MSSHNTQAGRGNFRDNRSNKVMSYLHLARRFISEVDKKKDSYNAHVFAVQLGEPGVVCN